MTATVYSIRYPLQAAEMQRHLGHGGRAFIPRGSEGVVAEWLGTNDDRAAESYMRHATC